MSKYINQDFKQGLSLEQVEQRKKDKLVNKDTKIVRKPNLINIHDILYFVGIFCLIYVIAILIVFLNIFVGIFADIKISIFRRLLNKKANPVTVIREGKQEVVNPNEVVIDDIVYLNKDDVICVDGIILEGEIGVDENNINGLPVISYKGVSSEVYKGSKVISGTAYLRTDKVGKTCYINQLHKKSKKIRRPFPGLLKFIDIFTIASVVITVLAYLIMLIAFTVKGNSHAAIDPAIRYFPMIIPFGIALLVTCSLLLYSHFLIRQRVYVQDLYSIPSLNDVDVICFDKTGTLTNHELVIRKTVLFDGRVPESLVAQKISNILCAVDEDSLLNRALKKVYDLELSSGVNQVLHFNNVNNYMGASFKGGKTLLIGLPEYMQVKNKAGVLKRCEEFIKEGLSVYILAEGESKITNGKYVGELEPVAMIIVEESVKEDIADTFKTLIENNIDIKIISGDDPQVVSAICYQAGLKEAINYVSLENVSLRDVKLLADKYTVFGKATPEQKEIIIKTLQESKKKVAMVGDGDNDILALKRAYLSICTDDASNQVKNVSRVIIDSKKTNGIVALMDNGRRFMNNFKRAISLYAMKTLFVFLMVIVSMIGTISKSFEYPLSVPHFLIWDILTSGLIAVLIMFDRDKGRSKDSLVSSMLKRSIPAGILIAVGVASTFVFYALQQKKLINLGVDTIETAVAMSVIIFTGLGAAALYKICTPLSKFRRVVMIVYCASNLFSLIVLACVSHGMNHKTPLTGIPFHQMTAPAYMTSIIIIAVLAAIYILVYNVVESFTKGDKNEN